VEPLSIIILRKFEDRFWELNMADNFTAAELAAYTPEQRAEIERIETAVDSFLADRRHLRYEPTDANQEKLWLT